MIIQFTAEELQHIQKIQDEYSPDREQLQQEIEKARAAGSDKDTLLKLYKQQAKPFLNGRLLARQLPRNRTAQPKGQSQALYTKGICYKTS